MAKKTFFTEQSEQSEAKARIVSKYFVAWSNIMLSNMNKYQHFKNIGYIDLFAGPGRYEDGSKSTPLMVLESALAKADLANVLITMFNDREPDNVASLKAAIDELPQLSALAHKPAIYCGEVGADAEHMFADIHMVPTFSFIDPFGYKGLSRGFIQSMVKDWGCDCVFFFNYGRINAGINNDAVRAHMDALFGRDRIEAMRPVVSQMMSDMRVTFVLEELSAALRDLGANYILPFRFKRTDGSRTSHALIFVSKNILGYNIMKDIMAKESSTEDEGVPSFTYSPADASTPFLFSLAQPIAGLANDLVEKFAGRTMKMKEIYDQHHVNTPFIGRNYKRALSELESSKRITASPAAAERPMRNGERTFGDNVKVVFQKESSK